jgi:hypothetical protein
LVVTLKNLNHGAIPTPRSDEIGVENNVDPILNAIAEEPKITQKPGSRNGIIHMLVGGETVPGHLQ